MIKKKKRASFFAPLVELREERRLIRVLTHGDKSWGPKRNESDSQTITKVRSDTQVFFTSRLLGTKTCGPPAKLPGNVAREVLVRGTTRKPETWKRNNQITIDSEEEEARGEAAGIEDRTRMPLWWARPAELTTNEIESPSWTPSSAAQAHDTLSSKAG